jgi:hypothetical protein
MTQQDIEWLDSKPNILENISISREELSMLFAIYNRVTGDNKSVTGCGRCVLNTKNIIKHHYDQARSNN